jgi:hypothetical protein
MSRCDGIAEALVMGDALSASDQTHVDGCAACQRLTALPVLLAATSRPAAPRPGFSARMMAAARERIAQRRRRRFATFTLALAAAGASAVAVDRTFIRARIDGGGPSVAIPSGIPSLETPDTDPLQQLESIRQLDHVVDWDQIEQPLHPTRLKFRHGGLK